MSLALAKATAATATPKRPVTCADLQLQEDRVRTRREALEAKNQERRVAAETKLKARHAAETAAEAKRFAAEQAALDNHYGCTIPTRKPRAAKAPRPPKAAREPKPPKTPRPPKAVREPKPPKPARAAKTPRATPAPDVDPRLTIPGGVLGDATTVTLQTSRGSLRTLPARFVLVSAASLVPSHDASTFDPRPDYPGGVQERRYDVDDLEKLKVVDIAQNMQPGLILNTSTGAIDGTPVVAGGTPIVLGGNGRTMGTQRHYRSGRTQMREFLLKHHAQFGLRRADVERLADPAVVRAIAADRADWPRLVRDLNVGLTQVMDATTEAAAQARQLPTDVLRTLAGGLEGVDDLGTFLRSRASIPLIGALERSGFITRANRGRMIGGDDLLSKEATVQLERQLLAVLVPNSALLERLGPELRGTLARSAPAWLAAASRGPGWDVREPLAEALDEYRGMKATGQCLAQWLTQASFGTAQTRPNTMGRLLLEILDLAGGKPVVFGRIARSFFESSSGGGLFGGVEPSTALLDAALGAGIKPESAVSRRRCKK